MKIARYDSGIRWDDPNLRWGSPSYILEPGDPGYVPPSPVTPPTPTKIKTKRMKRNSYYPSRTADQVIWLVNVINKMPAYATTLGLTPAQLAALIADCKWLVYVLESWQPAAKAWSAACTEAVTSAQSGDGSATMVLPVFAAPALPTGVAAVATGALDRIFTTVQVVKDSGKLTDEMAADLVFVGAEVVKPDMDAIQPTLKLKQTAQGVFLDWTWDGVASFVDMLEIQVDRDGAGWKFLANDTTPGYTDSFPLPASPAKWKYRAIWRLDDKQIGLWSNVVSINVG